MKLLILFLFPFYLFSFEEINFPEGKWWRNEETIKFLSLSKEQQDQLEKIFFSHFERAIDLKARVEKEEFRLKEILDKENFKEEEAMEQVKNLLEARKELEKERAELFVKVRAILNLEQWNKVRLRFQKKLRMMREEVPRPRMILEDKKR